jgi:hypothetical protein
VLLAGCASANEATGNWVGTVSTDGDVTTVVNESGSVWGGNASLVEELSIGVESGPPEYMFGEISWVHADDTGILVGDQQTPAVRQFAADGSHVRDIGGEGEGPGEYQRPEQIAIAPDGRIFVVDGGRRINVYDTDGEVLETLPLGRGVVRGGYIPLVIDDAGRPWLVYRDYDLMDPVARQRPTYVLRALTVEGPTGEPRRVPEGEVAGAGNPLLHPAWHWNVTPSGDLLVGDSGAYRFERRAADGGIMIVERYWEPVPVSEEETAYLAHLDTLRETSRLASNPIPATKPAFLALLGASTGETWLLRQGPGFRVPGCNDRPGSIEEILEADVCWQDALFFDGFDEEGKYLGSVDVPDEMREQIRMWARTPHFAGEHLTAVAIDKAGTIMVKRYRIVPSGEP